MAWKTPDPCRPWGEDEAEETVTTIAGVVMTEEVVVGALMEDTVVEDPIVGAGNAAGPLQTTEIAVALPEATGGDSARNLYFYHRLLFPGF